MPTTKAPNRPDHEEMLNIEEADAWFEYLEVTKGQTGVRYDEVEPWAWTKLAPRLKAVKAKREKLRGG